MSEGYQILINESNLLLAKQINDNNINLENENILIELTKSMVEKYKNKGILYINLTKEFNYIMNKIYKKEKVKSTDNRIAWSIRQAITRAIVEKNKEEN